MKQIQILLFPLIFLSIVANDNNNDDRQTFGKTFFNPRSQGSNSAIESVAIPRFLINDPTCNNIILAATPGYSQSYDRNSIGTFFFFNDTSTMQTGTAVGPGIDIFAENFLLNYDYLGANTAKPQVKNGFAHLEGWYTFQAWCQNFYAYAHVPIVHTSWQMLLDQTIESSGTIITANTLGNPTDQAAPVDTMNQAWDGQVTFFDVQQPMAFARIASDQHHKKSGVADVELALGYAFIQTEYSFWSVNLRTIIPTGNRPTGEFVFEPILGNGHHWEFGGGLLANVEIWNNNCDQSLNMFINSYYYYMFSTRQKRTFDLQRNGVGSRYLLLKKFSNPTTYAGEIVRGPNILTLDVDVKNLAHGEFTFMLDYIFCNWTVDLGYTLWGRSKDMLKLRSKIPENTYGIAGLSGTAGAGTNTTASRTLISGENATVLDATPVFLTNADIDLESARHPGCFSHSVFGNASYVWNCRAQPFIGIGTQIEFSGAANNALRMWYVWLKTGVSF